MILYQQFLKYFSFDARIAHGKVCIGDTSLRKYMPKYIKPTSNINKITCGCETCISDMLLQIYLSKWRISKLDKLHKLHINSALTRLLQRSKNYFIEYRNQIFPNK